MRHLVGVQKAINHLGVQTAMDDGVLIEIDTQLTREAGYRWRVRVAQSVVAALEPEARGQTVDQSFEGGLWNVLYTARVAIDNAQPHQTITAFEVILPGKTVTLWARLEGGDGPAVHIVGPNDRNTDSVGTVL